MCEGQGMRGIGHRCRGGGRKGEETEIRCGGGGMGEGRER